MLKRILAVTDFSPCADAAWRFAVDFAASQRAALVLLYVGSSLRTDTASPVARDNDTGIAAARQLLQERTIGAMSRGVVATGLIRTGEPVAVVATTAKDAGVDLVVVGVRPDAAPDQLTSESVTEGILHSAPCAVLVVKAHQTGRRHA